MLGSMTPELHRQFENYAPYEMLRDLKSMFEKQAGVERFELIQTFHACKQEEGKPVAAYVLKMKGYVDHLERLGYMLPQDLTVGLILNGLIKDFAGFMRNYNMHNTRKTIGELHAMLIEYEKGLPKKAETPQGKDKQVYIPKPKNPKPSAKEHPAKDDTCHHCKEVGHWKRNCPVYLAELLKKKKQVSTASSSAYSSIHIITQLDVSERRNHTLLDMVRSMMNLTTLPLSFWDYALESATRILNMVPTKKALVKQDTPDKLQQRFVKCMLFEKNLITQEVSGRAIDLEEIQDEDTSPSEITSEIPMEVKGFEPPKEEEILICRSERSRRVPNCLCLNVEAEEHSLGDLNEPTSYKAAMLDPESNKWLDAMNAEMQSMIDNIVWVLVDLPPNFKTVRKKYASFKDPLLGLMQASRSGIKDLLRKSKFGFAQNLMMPYVYQKASGSNVTFLILYVDDIIIMGNHIPSLQSVKDYLGKCFSMKDLGEAAFILGIKIYRDRLKRLIGLGQNAYMDKILKRYKMDNSKLGHIPMQERLDLNKTQGASTPEEVKRMQNAPYASAVGSIMYAYLRNTKDMFLVYGGNPEAELRVDCYCDAGFETNRDDTKSKTGYVFILNGGAVD
ncbi:zinc finger, CCHC-type containing protein [Tanacetum coccineum]